MRLTTGIGTLQTRELTSALIATERREVGYRRNLSHLAALRDAVRSMRLLGFVKGITHRCAEE
jgi:hypothetical protein